MSKPIEIEGCGSGRSECKNPSSDEHPCPYQEDINGDFENNCFCCEDCQQECADDI